MDIVSLTYFKKVAELQHITQAAAELHLAQPSLSRAITNLERELGVKLFERTGKHIILNQYGSILLKHTNRILQTMRDIDQEIADTNGQLQRTVTLSLHAASKLLPDLVMAFKQESPSIRLQIRQEDSAARPREECDLTLFASIQPVCEPCSITLIEESILLALPESNPLSQKISLNLSELANQEFICLQKGKSLRTITDTYCSIAGFEPNVILESDSPDTVRELIKAGFGISFIPSITWQGMNTASLSLVPISFPQCKRYINLSWRQNGYLSPAVIQFRDFVQRYFQSLPTISELL